jgi:hypothetical protein
MNPSGSFYFSSVPSESKLSSDLGKTKNPAKGGII